MNKITDKILEITKALREYLEVHLDTVVKDPLFEVIAVFLDTEAYSLMDVDDIMLSVGVVVERFKRVLEANSCDLLKIQQEMEITYAHTTRFLSRKPSSQVWPHLFLRKHQLGILNLLHVAEISIAIPASNAETEHVFSFLWRVFSKDRQSFKNKGLENIIRLRCDRNFDDARYDHGITMFLTEHPNGEMR